MRVLLAIVIVGLLITAAIFTTLRWEISAATGVVYRLDRWTGTVTVCTLGQPIECWRVPFAAQ